MGYFVEIQQKNHFKKSQIYTIDFHYIYIID